MSKAMPTLYKKSNDKIQVWDIWVRHEETQSFIVTNYGQFGGKIQTTEDVVTEGKNLGKKNATTTATQAEADAYSKWESKLKDGYVQSQADAEAGKLDALIEGGAEAMLAQSFEKHAEKILFPCFTQPKLDGIRCLAIYKNGTVTLWSRSRKRILSCPHIEASIITQLLEAGVDGEVILDGELYNHDLKNDFEKIISAVRKEEPSEASLQVQYHVYDMVLSQDFGDRSAALDNLLVNDTNIRKVHTVMVQDEEELQTQFKRFKGAGYEGAMARNALGKYEGRRSYNLQKVKEFEDADFEVIGVEEGKGKLRGLVGAFVCRTSDGNTFEAKPKGNQEDSRKYIQDPTTWQGKKLVVQFQGYTNKNKVPRFPVGLRFKDQVEG